MKRPEAAGPAARRRLPAAERRAAILDAARELVFAQGHLPLSVEALARRAGVSKALVYAHFPDPPELYAALMEIELDDLESHGRLDVGQAADPVEAACRAADVYLAHVASRGTVLHLLYRDPYLAARLPVRARRLRDRVLGGYARAVRAAYGRPAREAVAAVNLIVTIPEETGRLVFQRSLALERGRLLCRELVLGSLSALAAERRV